jgi:hypothetical protein
LSARVSTEGTGIGVPGNEIGPADVSAGPLDFGDLCLLLKRGRMAIFQRE